MLIRAIKHADVTARPVAVQADLLRRACLSCDFDWATEVAAHRVVELLYAVELGLEVRGCARTDVSRHTLDTGVSGVLIRYELRLHRHMAVLTTKVDRLGVLVRPVTAERRQKKKAHSTQREQRENPPVTFPRQIDLQNTVLLFNLWQATLRAFVQDRAEESEREAKKEKERCDNIREDADVRILRRCEEINGEEKNKSE
jgi:hypothetical protein